MLISWSNSFPDLSPLKRFLRLVENNVYQICCTSFMKLKKMIASVVEISDDDMLQNVRKSRKAWIEIDIG